MKTTESLHDPVAGLFKKAVSEAGVPYERLYLFGSRARGDASGDSDYDFFIVLDKDYPRALRSRFYAGVSAKIHASAPHISFDIIIRNPGDFSRAKSELNNVDNAVAREGVRL